MNEWRRLYARHAAELEDFWGRRETAARFRREVVVFGRRVRLASNDAGALTAVDHSLPLFSTAAAGPMPVFELQIVVRAAPRPPGAPPADLMNQTTYTGDGGWVMIHLAAWGQAYLDLARGHGVIVVVPELAARPAALSQQLLNTVLLNVCLGSGYGMLHASGLLRGGDLLLLLAPHNTGKSTTALRLLLAGWRLVTDSMVHVLPDRPELLLAGFPVGRIKLRGDMVAAFPQFAGQLAAEVVRDETKYVVDLRRAAPEMVVETAVAPRRVHVCLLARHAAAETVARPAAETAVWPAIMQNSLFFDTPAAWERNLAQVARLVSGVACWQLTIGTDAAGIGTAVDALVRVK
ncbi:MAG: hypothetical protein KC425_13415 [Anaerolineales bacterium]|nr:hypothetical protein [Anaerolineales bacterium]